MADTNTFREDTETSTGQISEKVSDVANTARDKAKDLGRRAADQVNESRGTAAKGLENAASAIHEKAADLPGGERVQNIAHSTADKLAATANYMRTHEVKDAVADVERIIRRNPGQSLLAAAVVGFFVGRGLRKD